MTIDISYPIFYYIINSFDGWLLVDFGISLAVPTVSFLGSISAYLIY